MKRTELYQTDFSGEIADSGCLVFSIARMILGHLETVGHFYPWPSRDRFFWFLQEQHEDGVLSRTLHDREFGGYVRSHRRYGNGFLELLGFDNLQLEYIAAHYMQGEGRESWGSAENHDATILHVNTLSGNGHFRLWDYDPYPGAGISKVRDIRYYRFKGDLS